MSEERRETKEVEKEGKGRKKGIAKLKKQKKNIFFLPFTYRNLENGKFAHFFFFGTKNEKKRAFFKLF